MTDRRSTPISSRRQPKQARSADLLGAILQAAIQVLAKEGVHRFTTTRVAERAGVSVGSVYQYFPNKASILFRLQSDEWRQTTALMRSILGDTQRPVLERVRVLTHAFVRSECEEAEVRTALGDAAPFYRDAPEAEEVRADGDEIIRAFMAEALPSVSDATRAVAGDLIVATLSAVGKEFSESSRTDAEIEAWADAMADMFCVYMQSLQRDPAPQ
ncbi:AcrR family transcriptional regulator [Variovorax boronicumulans]|uniref:TetR family transcriptional regulator n=1 Tax=Variovorax boronicumulans TaxID=436515 RepID=UPI0027802492|nr:TetR family transcriptional regulator [Variovorax boronicumulans]MDP9991098.1 AcrR family transcriptional regulator [Variovorax boronicumulans]MDQ0003126.1 AcrR family transcriptional regulator [Variovorax boronicumulans]